ncbi:MAG: PilW family protein [Chlorobium sp.]|nr:PilW family protein [Chlorobium sp.]
MEVKLPSTRHSSLINNSGFTLIELMLTVAISGIIIAAIYAAYISQQRTYLTQEQVAEMQQNIRAGLDTMVREIRMAGYDPTSFSGASIVTALNGHISFTQDLNANGVTTDPGEMVDFGFSAAANNDNDRNGIPDLDGDGDGIPDPLPIGRQTWLGNPNPSGYLPIAENIQAIEFRYLDSTETVTAIPTNIRSVQISILARAGQPDRNFTNTMTYTTASGVSWGPYNDNFRRRLMVTTVQCRNIGL